MMRENTEFKEVKGVGRIPVDWDIKELSELIEECRSGLSRQIQSQDIGIPVMISGNIQDGKLDTSELKYWYRKDPQGSDVDNYILKDRDILLCFINSLQQIGKLCLYKNIGREAIYTTNLFRIRSNDKVSPEFLYYLLSGKCVQNEIINITKPAVNQASFTKGDFLGIRVPYIPLREQEKIAQILSNVDMNIEKTEQAICKYKQVKKGLMDDLLTGKVRIKDGKRFKESRFKDVKGVGKIPWDWEVRKLDEVTSINSSALSENTDIDLELNYIDIESVTTGKINKIKLVKFKNAPSRARRIVIEKDVIVSTVRPYLKAFALIRESRPNLICSTGFAVLRAKEILNPVYLYQYTLTDLFIEQLNNKMVGSNYPAVNATDLRETLIIYPSDIEEQLIIAKVFSRQDEIIDKEEEYLEKLKKLKSGLMEELLTGKVRVKID